MIRSKLLVIELDGATWDVMNPLIEAGEMPHIASLMRSGVSGNLLSDPPLISPRLWVSIFSGKKSQDHGVEFFGSSSSMVKSKRLWDICSDKGYPVGVFGSFVTWPPYPVNGFMVPSLFSLGPETFPSDYQFLQELTLGERKKNHPGGEAKTSKVSQWALLLQYAGRLKRHGVGWKRFLDGVGFYLDILIRRPPQDDRYWRKGALHLKICTDFFDFLHRKYNPVFSTFHIHLCDALSHRYWKYYEPGKFSSVDPRDVNRYGRVIPEAYREADRTVGRFLELADSDTTVMILSDHGSKAMESLRESFKLRSDVFLKRLGVEKEVIPANVGFMTFLYFHDREVMAKVAGSIEAMKFEDNGQKVFDVIYEEYLLGIRLTEKLWGTPVPPDRMLAGGTVGSVPFADLFSPHRMEVSGDHKLEGVFIMSGPGVRRGKKVPDASIYDVTPTALALMGLSVAKDMHGQVLQDHFEVPLSCSYVDSYDASAPGREEEKPVEVDKVKERLKALGYL